MHLVFFLILPVSLNNKINKISSRSSRSGIIWKEFYTFLKIAFVSAQSHHCFKLSSCWFCLLIKNPVPKEISSLWVTSDIHFLSISKPKLPGGSLACQCFLLVGLVETGKLWRETIENPYDQYDQFSRLILFLLWENWNFISFAVCLFICYSFMKNVFKSSKTWKTVHINSLCFCWCVIFF